MAIGVSGVKGGTESSGSPCFFHSRRPTGSQLSTSFLWDMKLSRQTINIKANISLTNMVEHLNSAAQSFRQGPVRPHVLQVEDVFFLSGFFFFPSPKVSSCPTLRFLSSIFQRRFVCGSGTFCCPNFLVETRSQGVQTDPQLSAV